MADQLDNYPEPATLIRSQVVCGLIQRTFAVTYTHLSQLEGRTIKQFFDDRGSSYLHSFFRPEEKNIIRRGNSPVEEYSVHFQHKLLKHCCGLRPHNDPAWNSEDEANTLEFLITYCYSEYKSLCQASEMTDSNLNNHMDKVLKALILIIDKVEDCKNVNEGDLKLELMGHIGEKLDLNSDIPVSHHIYTIFSQHSVHTMFIIVYQQLNNLKGKGLSEYFTKNRIRILPETLYSNEHKFLEQNPPPQTMSISILYKVVRRVCFNYNPYKKYKESSVLESTLDKLKQEYNTPPANEKEYRDHSYKIYNFLKTALMEVTMQKKGKRTLKEIIQSLPSEPYIVKSFREPFELPTSSMQSLSISTALNLPDSVQPFSMSGVPNSHSPKQCSVSSPHASSQAMAVASTTASAPSSLTQEQLNITVLFSVLCPGGVVVQTLVKVFKALKGGVQHALKKKKMFTNDEKKRLEEYLNNTSNVCLTDEDITFICKLLRFGCASLSNEDDTWTSPKNTLEYTITLIRKERNRLSHDLSSIETGELTKTLRIIETYLKTILEMTQQKLGQNENVMKKDLEDQKKKVISEIEKAANSLPINSYYWTMEKIKEDMTGTIVRDARIELQQMHLYRENLMSMSPLGGTDDWQQFLTTRNVYVDRKLEDMSDIKVEGSYQIKDILFSQDNDFASSKITLIHGGHGEGKTSLCKHAFHLWSENLDESSGKGVELLIYIPCRFVTTKSISAYLKERLPKTFSSIDKDDIIPLMQQPRVVFVIDGYDEAGAEAKSLIDDILSSLPDSRVIITTKTQWLSKIAKKVKSVTSNYKVLGMINVTDDMRQQLIKKIFRAVGKDEDDCDKFLNYLNEIREKDYALICSPFTVCLQSLFWINNPRKAKEIRTVAQLYYNFYDLILKSVSAKLNKDKSDCQGWMITLGRIAWNNLKNNQYQLNDQDLETLKRKALESGLDSKDNNCILASLLQCNKVHDRLNDDAKHWNFIITSQQEYFAAEYIVDCLLKENSSLTEMLELSTEDDNYNKKIQKLVPIIKFVCGLLAIYEKLTKARVEEITELMSVTEPWAFMAVTDMFKPILKKSGVERVVKTLFMNQEMKIFESFDPQNILWILKHTSLTVSRQVTFKNTMSELPGLKPLLEFLLNSKSKSYSVKVMIDVDKVTNISNVHEFTANIKHQNITFTYIPQKPLCIAKLVQNWVWSSPLCLFLCPEVFPLVWWELLISLLSLNCNVTRIVYCSSNPDPKYSEMVAEGAQWLNAVTSTDSILASTELIIYCA